MMKRSADNFADPATSVRSALLTRGSLKWYFGGLVGGIWLVNAGFDIVEEYPSPAVRTFGIVMLALYNIAFLVVPPLNRQVPARFKLLLPLALFVLSFATAPVLGWGVGSLWTYVGVAAAMSLLNARVLVPFIVALTVTCVVFEYLNGLRGDALFAIPAIMASISLMMGVFARQIAVNRQLRETQHELARLAVVDERGRVARDLHDILGHSLTIIAVKAELARRLIETDPAHALREVEDLENLARGALADVRSTAAGIRGVSIAGELANARSAFEVAGITATLPGATEEVPPELRELFAWTVREGVTNVVRHSSASSAEVRIGSNFVEILDDGDGPGAAANAGNGLAGLRERATAGGATVTIGSTPSGGFRLRVTA